MDLNTKLLKLIIIMIIIYNVIMFVCLCNAITTSQIVQCVRSGHTNLDSVIKELGVGMNCGTCISMVSELIAKTTAQDTIEGKNSPSVPVRDSHSA